MASGIDIYLHDHRSHDIDGGVEYNQIGKVEKMPGYGDPPKKNRFKPGQSGNPNGRPKGSGIRHWLQVIAEEIDEDTGNGKSKGRLLAEKLYKLAHKGNSRAIDVVVDGVDGKLIQPMEFEPMKIIFDMSGENSQNDSRES